MGTGSGEDGRSRLSLLGVTDPSCPIGFADRLGQDTKAFRVLKLDCGHWTPIQKPAEVARALEQHWAAGKSK